MIFFKAAGLYIASDILCLFISATFTGMGNNPLLNAVCAVCTFGIIVIMELNSGMTAARRDMKQARISKTEAGWNNAAAMTAGTAIIPLASWGMLLLSKHGGPDFYRWHKLINAAFLKIFNFICRDASSEKLTDAQVWAVLPFAFAAAAAFLAGYVLVRLDIIPEKE